MSEPLKGATVNGSGTKIAAARSMGTGVAVDVTKADRDHSTLVPLGNMMITVKNAISHGILRRNISTGTLEELNPATTPSRVNA